MKHSKPKCPHCGSENVYGIARVVGYFSKIENWNKSKTQERTARVQSQKFETDTKGFGFVGFRVLGQIPRAELEALYLTSEMTSRVQAVVLMTNVGDRNDV